jgi:hypothetical protein
MNMSKINDYREKLKQLDNWVPYLKKNAGLPGPRGNLELAEAVSEEASNEQVEEFLSIPSEKAKENTPEVFLVFCGVVSLGKQIAHGNVKEFSRLQAYASDTRWRIREATAIALQYVGDKNMKILLKEMQKWMKGNWYEKRAVAAALAELRLLKEPQTTLEVLQIFDRITSEMEVAKDPEDEALKTLRKSMGYCWSVAVAASPEEGKPFIEKWLTSNNTDIRWIMKENLKKNRLIKMDTDWVKACNAKLE